MNPLKSSKIKAMRIGGRKLSQIRQSLANAAAPGVTLKELDDLARRQITSFNGRPSFTLVPGYHWATCLNLNQGIVHGIPSHKKIKAGDVLSIDMGLYYQGFHTDCATSIVIGPSSKLKANFLKVGRLALKKAIAAARFSNRVGHISSKIQQTIEPAGFNCARSLTGHGVGRQLHQKPPIPCLLTTEINQTPLLQVGQTLAIEVIYTQGKPELETLKDKWTLVTKDGKLSALFEETILITRGKAEVLTSP